MSDPMPAGTEPATTPAGNPPSADRAAPTEPSPATAAGAQPSDTRDVGPAEAGASTRAPGTARRRRRGSRGGRGRGAGASAGGLNAGSAPNGQPGNGQPANGQPGNGQPANGQPGNGQPGNGQAGDGQGNGPVASAGGSPAGSGSEQDGPPASAGKVARPSDGSDGPDAPARPSPATEAAGPASAGPGTAGSPPAPPTRPRIGDTRPAPPAPPAPPGSPPASGPASGPSTRPRPRVGDTRPAPSPPPAASASGASASGASASGASASGASASGASASGASASAQAAPAEARPSNGAGRGAGPAGDSASGESSGPGREDGAGSAPRRRRRRGGRGRGKSATAAGGAPRTEEADDLDALDTASLDSETLEKRRGRERKGRPIGRYLMAVHVRPHATQIAVLEGRSLIEYYVSRPQDDVNQIDGNIYLGRVQNVLPGMEAAFIDIGTPKNAVLYRGDVRYDTEDVEGGGRANRDAVRIEHLLRPGQVILCQVTKNPIGAKGARLTQEVSLPGRFVVLIPNSDTYGISKRLPDDERKRLRRILDDVRPAGQGLIVRTAAEGATPDELRRDVARLLRQWEAIEAQARKSAAPALLYREPDMAVRVIREEFNKEYRGVITDDPALHGEVREYVASISPELADRVELYDPVAEGLPLLERFHVHEQLHKALDRKVWLPSGGSLIIERTEALTVIDVNTGKNVGTSSLEETVYRNNLEAAEEIARQLRLRDIGGIIVIDFIDMEIRQNRDDVIRAFRAALGRDKTRTQVFDISELGLVEMTRKRISEGLVESMSQTCPMCSGRGILIDETLL